MRGRVMLLVAVVMAPIACTARQLDGVSPSYLIIESLEAAPGARPAELAGVLRSDVVTLMRPTGSTDVRVPVVFEDIGLVQFRLALKDPGSATTPTQPTPTNFITVTRYRVRFIRADGRNTPGVDVPSPFDGALTVTVGDGTARATLSLVRSQAKQEAPLRALAGGGAAGVISTIAEVTFFGTDQAGRTVSVTGAISVNFADWSDPD